MIPFEVPLFQDEQKLFFDTGKQVLYFDFGVIEVEPFY